MACLQIATGRCSDRPGIKAPDALAVDRDESIARLHHFAAFGWTARGKGVDLPRRHHGAHTCQGGPNPPQCEIESSKT